MNAHELSAELIQALAEHKAAKWGCDGVTDVNDTRLHDRADRAVALYKQESRRHAEKLANLGSGSVQGSAEFTRRARNIAAMKDLQHD